MLMIIQVNKIIEKNWRRPLRNLPQFNINIILIEPGFIRSNFVNNIKTVKGFDSNKSPDSKTVQQLFQGPESFINSSSHPVDVAQVILNAVNSPSPELRYPVGRDEESVVRARMELSDKDLEQWARKAIWRKKVSYDNDRWTKV